jgi:hypothetical protein
MKRFWYWLLSLYKKEYQVTVYFEGDTILHPDGTKITNRNPKTYHCKNIMKLSPKHIKLLERDDSVVEIKTIAPVGYDVKTKKWSPPS